jgi:hypothetical protein
MKKKERISPTTNLMPNTETLKESFKTTGELPSPEMIGRTVERVMSEIKQYKIEPKERNQRKRETIKGTILQAVMIDIELLKKVKREAFESDKKISDIINDALKSYFD